MIFSNWARRQPAAFCLLVALVRSGRFIAKFLGRAQTRLFEVTAGESPVPIQTYDPGDSGLPVAPSLEVSHEGCDIVVTWCPNSSNESGFYLYRWDTTTGGDFEQIAEFVNPPHEKSDLSVVAGMKDEPMASNMCFNPHFAPAGLSFHSACFRHRTNGRLRNLTNRTK